MNKGVLAKIKKRNTYFELEITSSFSFSHFLSSSPSVLFEILLFNNLVIMESRVFLENYSEYETKNFDLTLCFMHLWIDCSFNCYITYKYVRASSLTSSLLPSSPSSPSETIASQSFSLFTISSIRSAPQLSQGPAPMGQLS